MLILRSPKGGCCSISDDLSCSYNESDVLKVKICVYFSFQYIFGIRHQEGESFNDFSSISIDSVSLDNSEKHRQNHDGKYLIYTCKAFCGGLADRLRGIIALKF